MGTAIPDTATIKNSTRIVNDRLSRHAKAGQNTRHFISSVTETERFTYAFGNIPVYQFDRAPLRCPSIPGLRSGRVGERTVLRLQHQRLAGASYPGSNIRSDSLGNKARTHVPFYRLHESLLLVEISGIEPLTS